MLLTQSLTICLECYKNIIKSFFYWDRATIG